MTKKTELAPKTHALLSPSSAHRWLECPASILDLEKATFVETTNAAAQEGNRLHDLAEQILLKQTLLNRRKKINLLDIPEINYEDFAKIKPYTDFVIEEKMVEEGLTLDEVKVHVEVKLSNFAPDNDPYKISGTADCILETNEYLHVIDLKTGFHTVDAFENAQLGVYGLLAQLNFNKPVKKFTIVQREYVKTVNVEADWLAKLLVRLKKIDLELKNKTAKHKAGDWCQYCPLKFQCRTYGQMVSPLVKHLVDPQLLDNNKLADLYTLTNFLTTYIKAVNDEVSTRMIERGESIPGFKVIQGSGRRSWTKDNTEEEIIAILVSQGLPKDKITKTELVSFTQVEKLGKEAKGLVNCLTTKSAGGYKVVPNSEEGEPVYLKGDSLPAIED